MVAPVETVLEKLGAPARRRGTRWWCETCPLPTHGRQNPDHAWQNFFVRDNEAERPGQWHCYSCKAGGVLVELVEAVLLLDRDAAFDWLARLGEKPKAPTLRVRFDPMGPVRFRMPAGVELPPNDEWNSVPRRYIETRGITDRQVARWGLGYALEGRLQGRIVFPIRDQSGRLANYAARTFVGDEKRYLAAGDEERPDKSALFGEEFWRDQQRAMVVVFEGAVNGLAIERAAPDVMLAGLQGGHIDHRRLAKLGTFERIVVATDPDAAGDKVAREIASALGQRRNVVRLVYPTGQDAADTDPEVLRTVIRCVAAP